MSERYDRRGFLRIAAGGLTASAGLVLPGCAAWTRGSATVGELPLVRAWITSNSSTRPPELFPTRRVVDLPGFEPIRRIPALSRFGGSLTGRVRPTGRFQVEKVGERWRLVDPDGYPFLHIGMVGVNPRTEYGSAEAFRQKFGTEEAWANAAAQMLRSHGFNGTGSWSREPLMVKASPRMVYAPIWNFMSSYGKIRGGTFQLPGHIGYPNDAMFVFDPAFEEFSDRHARQLAATADDPFLLGHFSDNELPLGSRILDGFLRLPESDPGNRAAREWVAAQGSDPANITDAHREAFRAFVTDRYLSIVGAAIRRHDPNHLYLGPRFYGSEKGSEAVFRAAGKHLDVIAVNVYHEWTPNYARFSDWTRWSGRPVIITEWYAKGDDSGLSNRGGAGWTVATQQERGWFYQNFTLGLLETGTCVGWHWFKYMDNDPSDPTADPSNRDSNKGVVTIRYEPYQPLLDAMRELNFNAYRLTEYFDRRKQG